MTPAQAATLKAYIEANYASRVALASYEGAAQIAELLNKETVDFYIWNAQYPVSVIFDSIVWANLTPTDAPDGTQAWMNRSLACQGKQFNVQTILTGRDYLDFTKTTIRAGLQDALSNVPSGAGGALVTGGWSVVRDAGKKLATEFEKTLSVGTGTFASPAVAGYSQTTSANEIFQLFAW